MERSAFCRIERARRLSISSGMVQTCRRKNLRRKKGLEPLDFKRTILKGFRLSFPAGRIDFVEPDFATLKRDPEGSVHGTLQRSFQYPMQKS